MVAAPGHHVGDVDQSLGWVRNNKVIYLPASLSMLVTHVIVILMQSCTAVLQVERLVFVFSSVIVGRQHMSACQTFFYFIFPYLQMEFVQMQFNYRGFHFNFSICIILFRPEESMFILVQY